jgi:hypothetical protein
MAWFWYLAHLIYVYAGYLAGISCGVWAIWKGGPTEKRAAALIAIGWILSPILTRFDGPGPGAYVQTLDVLIFFAVVALALHSRRLWVFVLCMCILNGLVIYFAISHKVLGLYSYMTAIGFWLGYAQIICLAFGIIDYQNTLKRQQSTAASAV